MDLNPLFVWLRLQKLTAVVWGASAHGGTCFKLSTASIGYGMPTKFMQKAYQKVTKMVNLGKNWSWLKKLLNRIQRLQIWHKSYFSCSLQLKYLWNGMQTISIWILKRSNKKITSSISQERSHLVDFWGQELTSDDNQVSFRENASQWKVTLIWVVLRLFWRIKKQLSYASHGRHTTQWVTFGPYRADVNARNPARHAA